MIPLLALLGSAALASGDPNGEPTPSLVVRFTEHSGWGLQIGMAQQLSLGDHCAYREDDCRPENGVWGSLWPILEPRIALTWRGGARFAVEATFGAGLASLEQYHVGFNPYWELVATAGWEWRIAQAHGPVLGGYLTKSLDPKLYQPTGSYRLSPLDNFSLRGDFTAARPSGGPWERTWGVGLQVATFGAVLF